MAAKQAKTLEGSYIYSKVGKDGQGEYFTTITALIIQRLFQLAKIIAISAVGWLDYERWSED